MKVDEKEVVRIAGLAHLELEETDVSRLAEQLSSILTYMESLGRLDTSGVEPMFHALAGAQTFREDIPAPGLGSSDATQGAPGGCDGRFVVPRVVG